MNKTDSPVYNSAPPPPYPGGPGAQSAVYPPPGQAYPPPGQAYPPPGLAYPPPGQTYPQQVTEMTPPGVTSQRAVLIRENVLVGGTCPACGVGHINEDFTACGVVLAILFFPWGVICCMQMREKSCSHCGQVFGEE